MSLTSLFSTAQRALLASQAATNATGTNIANAETPGYTRRTVALRPTPDPRGGVLIRAAPGAGAGAGVSIDGFQRVREEILDGAVRRGRAGAGGAEAGATLLASLEGELAADRGDALLGALSGFFAAWSDVADAPAEAGPRDALLAAGDRLTSTLRTAAERVGAFTDAVGGQLRDTVAGANGKLAEIADLNVVIRRAQAQGADDLEALDRRDTLLDEVAGLAPFDIRPQTDGTVSVALSGMAVVQDDRALPLRLALPPDAAEPALMATGSDRPIRLEGYEDGALGAQLHVYTEAIPDALAALDALAADVVGRVNAAHAGGTGLDGSTGAPFFDPAGTTVATIRLDPDLTPDRIAAGPSGPGDGATATAIANLHDESGAAATRVLSQLGSEVRTVAAQATANAALSAQAEALRDGVSKVSLDEEMTNLIRYQQTYAASARVLQTATSLFDTLLAI